MLYEIYLKTKRSIIKIIKNQEMNDRIIDKILIIKLFVLFELNTLLLS